MNNTIINEIGLSKSSKQFLGRFIPSTALFFFNRYLQICFYPLQFIRRKFLARTLSKQAENISISAEKGYATFLPQDFPGTKKLVEICTHIADKEILNFHKPHEKKLWEKSKKFGVLNRILNENHLNEFPELIDWVLSDEIIKTTSKYFGEIPRLRSVEVWWSPKNETTHLSQKFHTDNEDDRSLRVIVKVSDVDENNGPFSFFDAQHTQAIIERLGREKYRAPMGGFIGKPDDKLVYSVTSKENLIDLKTPKGHGAMVDPCRCLHFGSRTRSGARIIYMAQFTSIFAWNASNLPLGNVTRYSNDPIRKLILGIR